MAEALYYVSRDDQAGAVGLINGVRAVIVNSDDADTLADHIAAAVAACNRAFPADPAGSNAFPAGYFDAASEISDLIAGPIPDDGDAIVFARDITVITEA